MRLAEKLPLIVLWLTLIGGLGNRPSAAAEGVSDAQILQAADQARFIEADSLILTMDITAERPMKSPKGQATVRALFKHFAQDSTDGYRVRIEFLQPPEMQGEVYLTLQNKDLCGGDNSCSFFWGPNMIPGQPLKVSAGMTTLFGDSSVAETAGIRFAGNYTIQEKKEDTLNGQPALALSLAATDPSVAFQQATLWVDPSSLQPIQAVLFALGGEPLARVTYEEYARLGDDQYVGQQRIENLLQEGSITQLTVTDVKVAPLSDELFDPGQLGMTQSMH